MSALPPGSSSLTSCSTVPTPLRLLGAACALVITMVIVSGCERREREAGPQPAVVAGGIDACVVGKWRSSQVGIVDLPGDRGGGRILMTVDSDGAVALDYSKMQPIKGVIGETNAWSGTAEGRITASQGTAAVKSVSKSELVHDFTDPQGKKKSNALKGLGPAALGANLPERKYTCDDSTLTYKDLVHVFTFERLERGREGIPIGQGDQTCKVGDTRACRIKWDTLDYVLVNRSGAAISEAPLYKDFFRPAMEFLKAHGWSASGLAGSSGLMVVLKDKIKDAIKDPKAIATELIKQIEEGKLKFLKPGETAGGTVGAVSGVIAANAPTLAEAIVTLEMLDIVFKKMQNAAYGVQLVVDVDWEECVQPFPSLVRDPRWEPKNRKRVKFTPIDPAGPDALSATTFNPAVLDPLFKAPLLRKQVDVLQGIANDPDELKKAGKTPKDATDELAKLRAEISSIESSAEDFKQRYTGKICSNAKNPER